MRKQKIISAYVYLLMLFWVVSRRLIAVFSNILLLVRIEIDDRFSR